MELSISLLLVSFGWVWCERCSDSLADAFRKGFHVADGCEDCVIHVPGISSGGRNWAGFCSGGKFFLFPDWKCREDNDLLNKTDCFVVGANELCELVEENHALNEECLKKFNSEICGEMSGSADLDQGDVEGSVDEVSFYDLRQAELSEASSRQRNRSTTIMIVSTTTTTQPPTTNSTPSSTTPAPSSTNNYPPVEDCERNEYFFNGHCYFILPSCKIITQLHLISNATHSEIIHFYDVAKCCQNQHPRALGLAVETKEENEFVFRLIRTSDTYHKFTFLTSGIEWNDSAPGEWRGWNSKVDESVFNVEKTEKEKGFHHYYIVAGTYWKLVSHIKLHITERLTLCERLYNPKNTVLELHKECLLQYRKSPCYSKEKYVNFCCERDDKGDIWYSCPSKTQKKPYPNGTECRWTCQEGGFFENDRPTCKGGWSVCKETYNGTQYQTAPTRYAIGGCPKNKRGFSTWYCTSNGTFAGLPDYSSCCEGKLQCRDTDRFLNPWGGCPSKKSVKKIICPPGSPIKEAPAEWYCDETGNFSETPSDFCNRSMNTCIEVDRFGREWEAAVGTTQKKDCPDRYVGTCYWRCESDGKFDGPEPDCSKCKADWMQKVEDKIKSDSSHEEVMAVMENYTKTEDLRVGYGYVLNLTSDCVTLFKKQTRKNETDVFDKFLKSYSKILKNVAANPIFWSSFSVTNRGEYAKQVVNTTQGAAFAALDSTTQQKYNATLAKSDTDGFDFFVAYAPSEGSRFPLENSSESDWHLDIKKINESNPNLAAMGLVMNYNLTSLMFPSGIKKEDLEINAPAVTFTVAESVEGRLVLDPNVVVSISFRHRSRTRFPQTQVIRRRLHEGELPSGVFNSTVCCYYRNSKWSTEGCSVTFTSKDQTNCTCNHLSTIGLLMTVHKYVPDATLEFLSTMSSGITIVSLILALLVFYFIDTVRNERVFIGKSLCFCLLIGHFLLLTVLDKKFFNISDNLCVFYAVLLHYTFMSAFAWMFVEGCHLYRMLVLVFDSGIEYRRIYLMIGYGAPFVIVGVTALVGFLSKDQPYGQDEFCWLKSPNYVWAFVGPVMAITSINFCILVTATKQAIASKQRFENCNSCSSKMWLKGWISLSALLGITWFLGLAYIHYNQNLAYFFVVLNGLQGFFIFLFRCVLCEQYKNIFLKKMRSWFFTSESSDAKRSETVKSDTKLCGISASKSLSAEVESRNSAIDTSRGVKSTRESSRRSSAGVDIDINITLTPKTSDTHLRSNTTAKSSLRKSCLNDSDNFPELSYHNI